MSATSWTSFPPPLELMPSAWPRRLRGLAFILGGGALWASALPGWALVPAAGALALLLLRWRPPAVRTVSVTPAAVILDIGGDSVTVAAPLRSLSSPWWLALYCPGRGWVWVFTDQAGEQALTPLRQVLWLNRRR